MQCTPCMSVQIYREMRTWCGKSMEFNGQEDDGRYDTVMKTPLPGLSAPDLEKKSRFSKWYYGSNLFPFIRIKFIPIQRETLMVIWFHDLHETSLKGRSTISQEEQTTVSSPQVHVWTKVSANWGPSSHMLSVEDFEVWSSILI